MATGGAGKLLGGVVGSMRTAGRLEQAGEASRQPKAGQSPERPKQNTSLGARSATVNTVHSDERSRTGGAYCRSRNLRAAEAADTGEGLQQLKAKDRKVRGARTDPGGQAR